MLILVGHATTPDKLKIVTSNVCDIDTYVSYIDCTDATPPVPKAPNKQAANITTATTTDILAGTTTATDRRNIKFVSIRNVSASITTDVTVVIDAIDGSDYEIHKSTLAPGERLGYDEGIGWFETAALAGANYVRNVSTADQGPGFATDTYLTGSNVLVGTRLQVGSMFRWRIVATKTAAGTATPIWVIRFGTNGSISDTARNTMTSPAQTAAVDTAVWEVIAHMRAIGAAGVCVSGVGCSHALATTGFSIATGTARVTSGSFDSAVASLQVGLSVNGGASAAWTVQQVQAEAFYLSP